VHASEWNEWLLHVHILDNKNIQWFLLVVVPLKNSGSLFVHRGVIFYQCSSESGSKLTYSHPIIGEPDHSKSDPVQEVYPPRYAVGVTRQLPNQGGVAGHVGDQLGQHHHTGQHR